jgi:hypothetical protein
LQASKVRLTSSENIARLQVTSSIKSSAMSQVHNLTQMLLNLPVEILIVILGHLEVRDLVQARRVSTNIYLSELLIQSFQDMQ